MTFRNLAVLALLIAALGTLAACGQGGAVDTAAISKDLGSLLSDATQKLGSINSLESARAALPDLREVDGNLGDVMEKAKALAPDMKTKVAAVAEKAMPALEGAVAKVMDIEGVRSAIGPVVDSMMSKLKSLV